MKRIVNAGMLMAGMWLVPIAAVAQEDEHHAPAGGFESTRFAVQGFSDVTFRAERFEPAATDPSRATSTFSLGQFSLFLSAQIAPNITVVSETALVVGSEGRQATSVTLERVYVKYVLTDAFRVAVGRTHTALGYWNEVYHHGALLHPTVARPEILRFGGVMPVHSVGIEVSGRVPVRGGWEFSYVGNLANGRARDFNATQGAVDVNTGKATAAKVSFAHGTDRIVMFGPMIYRDVVPSDPARADRAAELTETIAGAHFVYRDARVELLSEYFDIHHDPRAGSDTDHTGWYVIAAARTWRWKPYAGLDVTEFSLDDPYFLDGATSVRRYLAGLRYDINTFNALKFEVRREQRSAGQTHAVVINTAFAF